MCHENLKILENLFVAGIHRAVATVRVLSLAEARISDRHDFARKKVGWALTVAGRRFRGCGISRSIGVACRFIRATATGEEDEERQQYEFRPCDHRLSPPTAL